MVSRHSQTQKIPTQADTPRWGFLLWAAQVRYRLYFYGLGQVVGMSRVLATQVFLHHARSSFASHRQLVRVPG